jgi:hypothetical protein
MTKSCGREVEYVIQFWNKCKVIYIYIYMCLFQNWITYSTLFHFHGSVHIGIVYVQLKVQLYVLLMYSLFLPIFLALHVTGTIVPILLTWP